MAQQRIRIIVGVTILIVIALVHAFRIGSYLNGEWYILYYSYASDIMMPFGMYFLLVINEIRFPKLRRWWVKALIIFILTSITELMQAFGIHFLGVTFDFMDFVMFGVGVLLAVVLDTQILLRFVPDWKLD